MNVIKIINIFMIVQCLIFGLMIKKKDTDFRAIANSGGTTVLWFVLMGVNIFDSIHYVTLILGFGAVIKLIYYLFIYILQKLSHNMPGN